MIVTANPKPSSVFDDGPFSWRPGSVASSAASGLNTWVLRGESTASRIPDRSPLEPEGHRTIAHPRPSASRTPLVAGSQLGPYRLLKLLGRGAQGVVWKAIECGRSLDFVAIKVLKPALAYQPNRLAQFRREAERGLRFAGPSLLRTYEISLTDGYYFMVMPFVDGISLREVIQGRLARESGSPSKEIHPLICAGEPEYLRAMTRIMAEATRALARAHDQRIAHRDIKPANILLDERRSDRVYLCDFGLGRDLEIATIEQMRDGAGTPMYMAPERLLRIPADEIRCDIYSMGATLFEALTLERPIEIHEDVALQALPTFLAHAPVRRPSAIRPGFPEELEDVILKAMERDPARRYDSAREFAEALDRVADRPAFRRTRTSIDRPRLTLENRPHFSEVPSGRHQVPLDSMP